MRRVVITGLGAITPIGNTLIDYWNHLLNGVSGANRITLFDTSLFKTNFACEVKNYDPLAFFNRKEIRRIDRFSQFGIVAAEEAVQDAGIDFDRMDRDRIGVIFSSGIGGFSTFENEVVNFCQNDFNPRFNPFFIPKIITNTVAGIISIRLGLRGVNSCPVTACASSTQGLVQAFNYVRWGKADMIITGGAEASITGPCVGGFNAMKALSPNNDNYKTASRPFDKTRDGFVMGEGAGALIVESLESAIKRGARIYAEIGGGGESADAYHVTGTHPDGLGAYLAMKEAVREAEITPDKVDYVNAHATSTGLGDLSEIKALSRLFGDHIRNVQISGTKSMTGHLFGASGAIEAVATTMTVFTDDIPPTINTTNVDEQISPDINLSLGRRTARPVHYAMSNSFGFGGHCAAILMKKYV